MPRCELILFKTFPVRTSQIAIFPGFPEPHAAKVVLSGEKTGAFRADVLSVEIHGLICDGKNPKAAWWNVVRLKRQDREHHDNGSIVRQATYCPAKRRPNERQRPPLACGGFRALFPRSFQLRGIFAISKRKTSGRSVR